MEQIDATTLARKAGEILERVVRGEQFEVVRYGRVVARLVPAEKGRVPPPEPSRREPLDARGPTIGTGAAVGKATTRGVQVEKPEPTPQTTEGDPPGKTTAAQRQAYVDGLLKRSRGS